MNTTLSYTYRDASNYKQHHEVTFAGDISKREELALRRHLDEGLYFIPGQVDLPDLQGRFGKLTDDDHAWHELTDIEMTDRAVDDPDGRSISQFVEEFVETAWLPDEHLAELQKRLGTK